MRHILAIAAAMLTASCQTQSPAPVLTPEEAADKIYCETYVPEADAKSSGLSDPLAACMQWRKAGWGKGKRL